MRTSLALCILMFIVAFPGVCFAQGQVTLPDALRSNEPAKVTQPKKAPPPQAKPEHSQGSGQPGVAPAAVQKSSPRPPSPADASKFTRKFEDTFTDNRNHWETGDHKFWRGEIRDGAYMLEHKRNELGWIVSRSMSFDASGDYMLEAEFSFISTGREGFFGLVIGLDKSDKLLKYQRYSTTADGVYMYTERVFDVTPYKIVFISDMVSKTDDANYRKGLNVKNTLTAIHYDDRMYLWVNGVQVANVKYKAPGGDKVGFMAGLECTIKVHRLTYKTITP